MSKTRQRRIQIRFERILARRSSPKRACLLPCRHIDKGAVTDTEQLAYLWETDQIVKVYHHCHVAVAAKRRAVVAVSHTDSLGLSIKTMNRNMQNLVSS